MQTTDIVIAGAVRTAVGAFNSAFANTPAHELGAAAVREAIVRAKVEAGEVDEVILGQILTAGEGQNPARQAGMGAMPISGLTWGWERARKVLNDRTTPLKSGEENVRFHRHCQCGAYAARLLQRRFRHHPGA